MDHPQFKELLTGLPSVFYDKFQEEASKILEEYSKTTTYLGTKTAIIRFLYLGFASLRSEMSTEIAELWEKDPEFAEVWTLLPFNQITEMSKCFCKVNGDMLESKYTQKEYLTEDSERHELMYKFYVLQREHCDQRIIPEHLQELSLVELRALYKCTVTRLVNERMYKQYKNMIQTVLMFGVAVMNTRLSDQIRDQLKSDPQLKSLWHIIPLDLI